MSKIPVTQTIPDENNEREWIYFSETDVRKACQIMKCKSETIEECILQMKGKETDCTTCFVTLVNDLDAECWYESELGADS